MKLPRWLRILLLGAGTVFLLIAVLVGSVWIYFHPACQRTTGIVYGTRAGKPLTLDIIRPAKPNGLGIILMASGGWRSTAGSIRPWILSGVLRRGYTVFPVYHVSQPEASVMDITEDVMHAVRFVRHRAKEYGIDPGRLGVTGGSAGGHLSLMLATRGGPGPESAADPVDRESSAVQAVAIFYPVTDLLNLGSSTENLHDDGPPKSFVNAFGASSTNREFWKVAGREMSPIYFINSNLPPTLIYHGDADTLVPLDQSQRFQTEAHKLGRTVEIVVHHGGKHGWLTVVWDVRELGKWFDRYLKEGGKGNS